VRLSPRIARLGAQWADAGDKLGMAADAHSSATTVIESRVLVS